MESRRDPLPTTHYRYCIRHLTIHLDRLARHLRGRDPLTSP